MKIQFAKQNMLFGINAVSRVVGAKTTLPVLSCVLIKTVGRDKVEITGFDLEMSIQCVIPAIVSEEGACLLPARHFSDLVKRLPDHVMIETENYDVLIKYGKSQATINGLNPDEYPAISIIDQNNQKTFTVTENELKTLLGPVVYAASDDENKPAFTGVLLEAIEGKETRAVTTDGHRLALTKHTATGNLADINVLVPQRAVSEVLRLVGQNDNKVEITITESQLIFKLTDITVASRLIDSQFPNYRQVIPSNTKTKIKVKLKDLLEASERALLLARSKGAPIVKFNFSTEALEITAKTETGKINEVVSVLSIEGDPIEIAFNASYLIEALKNISAKEISMCMSGPLSPCIMRPVDTDDLLSLVLPVRMVA